MWLKCEINKSRITDVVVVETLPVGREKRNDGDTKFFLGLKLADGSVLPAFFDLKKSVLENTKSTSCARSNW